MSWARLDDSAWDDDKIRTLREQGNYQAIALWALALSYTSKQGRADLSAHEAAMLLCCDLDEAAAACEALLTHGLLDESFANRSQIVRNPLTKQNGKHYAIHNWSKYRSRDEAKSLAGRKGGEKSGESRRSKREAEPKQTRSNPRSKPEANSEPPIPIPKGSKDPFPRPEAEQPDGEIRDRNELGNLLRSLGCKIPIAGDDRLGNYLPANPDHVRSAVEETRKRIGKIETRYVLQCLLTLQTKPSALPESTEPAQARADREAWIAIGKPHGMLAMLRTEEDQLRALGAPHDAIERHVRDVCAEADKGELRSPDWGVVIDRLKADGFTPLRVVEARS